MFEPSFDSQQGEMSTLPYNHQGLGDFQDPLYALNPADSSQLLSYSQLIIDTVIQSIDVAKDFLTGLNSNSQIYEIMDIAFGQDYQKDLADEILQHLAQNNFTNAPDIKLVSGQNFNGAYSQGNNTIYLSQEFVADNLDNVGAVTGVLLEEFGHYIDGQINVLDAAGDEGYIFSQLVQGNILDSAELGVLKLEDDHDVFVDDGVSVGIEKNVIFYEHSNFGGAQRTYGAGSYELGNTWWNDKISSISVQPGWVVEAYEHSNFGGQKVVWTSSQSYVTNFWNDKISSLKVYQTRTRFDLNGDGRDDVIVRLPDGNVDVWLVDAQGKGTSPTRVGWADPSVTIAGIGDLNGDRRDDVIVRLPDGNVDVWLVDAQGKGTQPIRVGWADPSAKIVGIGDLNGDRRDDVIVRLPDGNVDVWLVDAQGNGTSPTRVGWADPSAKIVGIGDLNGDRRDDVIVRLPDGNVDVWLVDAQGKGTSSTRVGWADPSVTIAGIGDLNGDRRDDVIVRLPDGNVDVWLVDAQGNGTSPTRVGWADPSAKIVTPSSVSGYYRELSSLIEEQWDKLGGESAQFGSLANFSGGDKNTQTISNTTLQVYKDMSKAIFGTENKVNVGYGYDFGYYGTFGAHSGIDIQTNGQIVKSAINGVVAVAPFQYSSTNGWWMAIDEVNASGQKTGRRWWYGHLDFNGTNSSYILGKGTRVTAGQTTIARQVLSGQGHLHLTVTIPTASELSTPTGRSDYNNVANGKVDLNGNGRYEDGEEYIRSVNLVRGRTMNPLHAYWLFRNI